LFVRPLLEKLGIEVEYPFDQTCCGQPMANSGCESDARATEELFIRNFSAFEYIVIPSGSCTHHIRNKFIAAPPSPERDHVQSHVYDLVEFLHDVLKAKEFPWATFPHKIALHTSCPWVSNRVWCSQTSNRRAQRQNWR
jgi:L-lactate dehydrogenase complex protein LldE